MAALYGIMAEFRSAEALLAAARAVRAAGARRVEAYSPMPVEGLAEELGHKGSAMPRVTLLAGIAGGVGGYLMQWYAAAVAYPINVGGRPLHSWPMFIPVAFELTVLCAALAAVIGMLAANGLPRLNHPVFDAPDFDLASRDRFFLCLRCGDELAPEAARRLLAPLAPVAVVEVRQ
ncbi:DUF3341 domain-containing protein [Pigmentiphaga soli]|uniref:DUF3341 domain-containing protein n=1 Tax=Pigmentiphaga soli TaxID=1007095 RepID=A0ABP8GNT5_9BURK